MASGEGLAQQGEGPKMEMESWQKECDSLRKVTNGVRAVMGQAEKKRDNVLVRNCEFLAPGHLRSAA